MPTSIDENGHWLRKNITFIEPFSKPPKKLVYCPFIQNFSNFKLCLYFLLCIEEKRDSFWLVNGIAGRCYYSL